MRTSREPLSTPGFHGKYKNAIFHFILSGTQEAITLGSPKEGQPTARKHQRGHRLILWKAQQREGTHPFGHAGSRRDDTEPPHNFCTQSACRWQYNPTVYGLKFTFFFPSSIHNSRVYKSKPVSSLAAYSSSLGSEKQASQPFGCSPVFRAGFSGQKINQVPYKPMQEKAIWSI